jgi:ADP-heptose:LPS heptosyltransferase
MYLLYAPPEKFGILPPKTPLITDEVLFTNNVAYCPKFYWKKYHVLQGCRDITPGWMRRMRNKRELYRILFIACGGFGDVMWTMPVMEAVRKKYPRAIIFVATEERTMPIFQGVPYANACVSSEFWNLQSLIRASDEVYDFGGIATFLKKEMKREPVEACFYHVGLEAPKTRKEMRPHLVLNIDEGKQAEAILRKGGISPEEDKIITIALESSTPNRNWVFSYAKQVSEQLVNAGHKVIWLSESKDFGDTTFSQCKCGFEFCFTSLLQPESLRWQCPVCKEYVDIQRFKAPDGVLNLGGKTSIRQAISIIALSDVFVGPCSGLMVIATALEIPSVGLFGAFSPHRIAKYYDKFIPLWGRTKCAPCNEHWTECREGYPAPCMKLIQPNDVLNAVYELLKKYPRQPLGKLPIE